MQRFVVFLRAINVGGHNVVKRILKEAFTSLGFSNVSTFKQSGNMLFETEVADPEIIKAKVKHKLRLVLGYEVGVFVRTPDQLKKILESEPFKRREEIGASFQVTFLEKTPESFPIKFPLTIPNSTAEIISATTRSWNVLSEIVKKCSESE
jgi:uncharacterized protein (DUF1697 family)